MAQFVERWAGLGVLLQARNHDIRAIPFAINWLPLIGPSEKFVHGGTSYQLFDSDPAQCWWHTCIRNFPCETVCGKFPPEDGVEISC